MSDLIGERTDRLQAWGNGPSVHDDFEVRVDRSVDATRIALAGEVDLAVQDAVRRTVTDVLTDCGTADLVIDLREVTFMDSSGVSAAVVETLVAAERAGVRLHLEVQGPVREKLWRFGLDQFIPTR